MENQAFDKLTSTVAKLRDPQDGCPWDLEQTHQSLAKYLQEETQELLEVIKDSSEIDYELLLDELGDVLLQVMLHSQLASESSKFNIDDVVKHLNEKLIRRHPHVFGDSEAKTIEEVEKQWAQIKDQEKESKNEQN